MSFRPVSLPLGKGLNQSASDFALGANDLIAATNVVYTQNGAIRGRPGQVSLDGPVVGFDGQSTGTGLAVPSAKYQFAGVHTDAAGNVFAQFHGRLFRRMNAQWIDVGPVWSMRRTTYSGLQAFQAGDSYQYVAATACMDMGANFTNSFAVAPSGTGVVGSTGPCMYNLDGTILGPVASPPQLPGDTQQHRCQSVANQALFYRDANTLTTLRVQLLGATYPATTTALLASNFNIVADTDFNSQRVWAAWDGTSYYVAYVTGTNPNDSVTILKVDTTGTVIGTQTFTTTTTVLSLCLAVDAASGKGLLFWTGPTTTRSEVFTLSTMASLGLGVSQAPLTAYANPSFAVCGIFKATGYLAWCGHPETPTSGGGNNTLEVATRGMGTAAAVTIIATYDGLPNAGVSSLFTDGSRGANNWRTMFPPTVVAGRVLLGLQYAQRGMNNVATGLLTAIPCTWLVVDITDSVVYFAGPATAAAGAVGGSVPVTRAASCSVVAGSLLFGVAEGVDFTLASLEAAVLTPIKLTPQAAPSAAVGSYLYFGGNVSYVYDGSHCYESNWIQGQPTLMANAQGGAGQTVGGQSYTYSAVWVYYDSNGRAHRSMPSRSLTFVSAATSNSFNFLVSNPLFTTKPLGAAFSSQTLVIEVYGSQGNPGANDPLTIAATGYANITPAGTSSGAVVINVPGPGNPTGKQLYTSGNVLADERVPADRGLVVSEGRVWTADEHNIYPSHKMVSNVAPSWNTEVFAIPVPGSYGSIQGLVTFDDKVVAVCDSGCFAIAGPGLDNLGQGSGWSDPQRVSSVGSPGPARAVCSHPQGGAFIGQDGLLYGISRSLVVQCLGQAVRDFNEATGDLVYVPAGRNVGWDPSSNPLLVYGTANLRVLDLATGLWCVWTGPIAASMAGASTGLVVATAAAPYVVQFSASGGLDLGGPFSMSIRLNPQEMAGNELMSGWGRLRSINPVFKTLGAHTVSVQAYADEQQIKIVDKSFTVGP